jgi:hypothetical protein
MQNSVGACRSYHRPPRFSRQAMEPDTFATISRDDNQVGRGWISFVCNPPTARNFDRRWFETGG